MCRAHDMPTLTIKIKSLKAFCLYRQMIGKAQELKSGGGFTDVRSRALSSCAICTEYTRSVQSILNALHLIQIIVSGKSFLSTNPQLSVDFYLQIWLTKQRLVCILNTLEKKLTAQRFLVRCLMSWGWCFSLSFIIHFTNPSWIAHLKSWAFFRL